MLRHWTAVRALGRHGACAKGQTQVTHPRANREYAVALLIAILLFVVAFAAFGFFWHVLWLGVLVGVLVLVGRLAMIGLDPNRPAGRLNIGVLNSLGRYLVEISERPRYHRGRRAKGGVEVVEVVKIVEPGGGAVTPSRGNTRTNTSGTMTEEKAEQAVVMADVGMTQAAIANELGVSRSTVSRYLRRRRSSGKRMQKERRGATS
jgi:Homeodomain-like domain